VTGIYKLKDKIFLKTSRGFQHDQARSNRRKLLEQLLVTHYVVVELFDHRIGCLSNINLGFRNVDADEVLKVHSGCIPSLQMRARGLNVASALAAVRACSKTLTTIQLTHGRANSCPEGHRSVANGECFGRFATLSSQNTRIGSFTLFRPLFKHTRGEAGRMTHRKNLPSLRSTSLEGG
jgi:hypothetical protein